jgi:hypothetical protein
MCSAAVDGCSGFRQRPVERLDGTDHEAGMTNDAALWTALHAHLPRKTWVPIAEIYGIVQQRISLDEEDLERTGSRSASPRWQTNVRRMLHSKQREGALLRRRRPSPSSDPPSLPPA